MEDSLQLEFFSWPFRGPAPIPACMRPPPASSNPWAANGSHRVQCAVAPPMTIIARAFLSGSVNAVSCSNALRGAPPSKSFARFAVTSTASLRTKAVAPCPMGKSANSRDGYALSGGSRSDWRYTGRSLSRISQTGWFVSLAPLSRSGSLRARGKRLLPPRAACRCGVRYRRHSSGAALPRSSHWSADRRPRSPETAAGPTPRRRGSLWYRNFRARPR